MKKIFLIPLLLIVCFKAMSQIDSAVYSKFTTQQNRAAFYKNLVNNSIIRNLSLPLNNNTEIKWQSAFSAIALINYQQPWINAKIIMALDSIQYRTTDFQQSLIEMLYAGKRTGYYQQINSLVNTTNNVKVFSAAIEYLLMADTTEKNVKYFQKLADKNKQFCVNIADSALLFSLDRHITGLHKKHIYPDAIKKLFSKNFLQGNVIVYSLQRKNRNFPGISIIKDTAGNFVIDSTTSMIFSVPQLARSLSNMPSYLSNGNTPQGIFRMFGMAHSKSSYIGPTENLQLTMPFETSMKHFLKDSTITDSVWSRKWYAQLLPVALKDYQPLFDSYYASAAGRTEIIAHGTAVDETFYTGQTYYPFTPTAGCLCTRESWDGAGKRIFSDQQKLADAVKKAGGANGYLIVLELNDEQKKVSLLDILPYIER